MSEFVHLHLHTEYSLLDGACRIKGLMDRVAELSQKAVAITDHGVMYGVVDFYKAAKAKGIKPIIGCEVYVATRTMSDKVHRIDGNNHLVLLCKNQTGYKNLCKLVSAGFTEGFYSKPRIDKQLLERHCEGLICLSACLAGEVPSALLAGDAQRAREAALFYKNLFKDDFFIEIQDHRLPEQQQILAPLAQLARELDIPLVATNDAHYLRREDSQMQRALICVGTNKFMSDPDVLEFGTDEFYVKSTEEMSELFPLYPQAISNTALIAERCNCDFEFGVLKLPQFAPPTAESPTEYFKRLARDGFTKLYKDDEQAKIRFDYEVDVIESMGFVDYFLIVADFIAYAKQKNIPVGPGRGSGAGSLVAYCLGITGVDPLEYGLLFERFLNPERVSMPDFDIDFCYERRGEVIDYVVDKYGTDHVAQIITFGTLAPKAAVRDIGRVMSIPYNEVDRIAKLIPTELKITLQKALAQSKELKQLYEASESVKQLLDMAAKVEGMPRHASTHAAGVVITPQVTSDYLPLAVSSDQVVTQFPMTTIEELGLLKMDFLGLRTLTVIQDCVDQLQKTQPDFSIENIALDDTAVYEMLSSGETAGVFQFEGSGIRGVMTGLRPTRLEDLIAVTSLYRPGPMDSIPDYIRGSHAPATIVYKHEKLKDILKTTNGCIVYQEQVMDICRKLAGFSYGRADIVRRAMSKKKHDVMHRERQAFVFGEPGEDGCVGCIANGVDEKAANEIFDEMVGFASYAFNKSHAAAYALVAYRTAYLKCHYEKEFMAALLTSVLHNTSKVMEYSAVCQRRGISLLPPDINRSGTGFTADGDGIRYGLLAIKNVGSGLCKTAIAQRKVRPFDNLYDFCKRLSGTDINKRAVECLIKSGAFDSKKHNRKAMLMSVEMILKAVENERRENVEGQLNLFGEEQKGVGEFVLPQTEDFTISQRLVMEKEVSGLYLSGHPLDDHKELARYYNNFTLAEAQSEEDAQSYDNRIVSLICSIVSVKLLTTRKGDLMSFCVVEDKTGQMEVVVFAKILEAARAFVVENEVVLLVGRVSVREDEPAKIVAQSIRLLSSLSPPDSGRRGLYLRVHSEHDGDYHRAMRIAADSPGNTSVYIRFTDTGRMIKLAHYRSVSCDDKLLTTLRDTLGGENVVFVE